MGLYVQRPQSPLIRLRAKSKRGEEPEYDARPYLKEHYSNGDPVELEKIAPYKFRIIPQNKGPDPKLIEEAKLLQEKVVGAGNNKLFISVQSNWTDRTELFGFFNQIEGKYSSTPFLKFLQQASDNPAVPHLLILDEMNLSKVEHYFSDFLSCLESRILDGNEVSQEPIYLHGRGDYVEADDPLVEVVPSKLYLPQNLYVTGTVNVDETTYMFSPKVLDRANVIEFNDVDFSLLEGSEAADDTTLVLSSVPIFRGSNPVNVSDYLDAPEHVRAMLKELVEILKPHSLHFGYRVAQEVARFVNSVRTYVGDEQAAIDAAVDAQLVQKVLPKFSGSQAQLEEPLRKVLFRLLRGQEGLEVASSEQITQIWLEQNSEAIDGSRFPLATDKIRRMLTDLNQRGFTSFIG
jgi:5-methylcytosine-specific restriction endonuclease McrBC GTP-binding regulatory subunit McrB